jgi:hypothetical protein
MRLREFGYNINEADASKEIDYNDPAWDETVLSIKQKAELAKILKSKGKEPKVRWNPETRQYYVDYIDTDDDKSQLKEQGVAEGEKHGLYYNVNKRKAAGTSRPASSPKAPTAQAWKDAAKTAKNESVAEDQLDELSKDTLKNYVRAQPARIKGPAGLATTDNKKAARIVDPVKGDIRRAMDKYKDPEYGHQQRRLPEDSLAAMRRLSGVSTPPTAAVPNGPRQYRHMPTAAQPR